MKRAFEDLIKNHTSVDKDRITNEFAYPSEENLQEKLKTLRQLPWFEQRLPEFSKSLQGLQDHYKNALKEHPTYKQFIDSYDQLKPIEQNLANLTALSLNNLNKTDAQKYGTFDGTKLRTLPPYFQNAQTQNLPIIQNYYDPATRNLTLSPYTPFNPVSTFIHEGRHALDHLYKRPYQNEMLNFFADVESKNGNSSIDSWLAPLLEDSQKVISNRNFVDNYPYNNYLKERINGFLNSRDPENGSFKRNNGSFNLKKQENDGDTASGAFSALSEFPAHIAQELGNKWNTEAVRNNDNARKFLKENLRVMYRDYDELSNNSLSNNQFPDIKQAFFDRYNQLRRNKGPFKNSNNLLKFSGTPKKQQEKYKVNQDFPVPKYSENGTKWKNNYLPQAQSIPYSQSLQPSFFEQQQQNQSSQPPIFGSSSLGSDRIQQQQQSFTGLDQTIKPVQQQQSPVEGIHNQISQVGNPFSLQHNHRQSLKRTNPYVNTEDTVNLPGANPSKQTQVNPLLQQIHQGYPATFTGHTPQFAQGGRVTYSNPLIQQIMRYNRQSTNPLVRYLLNLG
jgi:hypothetical protein